MAIYECRCGDCGIFERSQPMGTATESARRPRCGRDARRVFSVPTAIFDVDIRPTAEGPEEGRPRALRRDLVTS